MSSSEQLQEIVTRMYKEGVPPEKAVRKLKSRLAESARFHDEAADAKAELYKGIVDDVIAREIKFLRDVADAEWARITELDAIVARGWRPA